jgi:hypothetical protein
MKLINVIGNGQVTYTLQDDNKKISGINTVECSLMNIDVEKNKLKRISFQEKPMSIIYPTDDLPFEWKKLKGFLWRGSERIISKKDIWN